MEPALTISDSTMPLVRFFSPQRRDDLIGRTKRCCVTTWYVVRARRAWRVEPTGRTRGPTSARGCRATRGVKWRGHCEAVGRTNQTSSICGACSRLLSRWQSSLHKDECRKTSRQFCIKNGSCDVGNYSSFHLQLLSSPSWPTLNIVAFPPNVSQALSPQASPTKSPSLVS